MAKMQSTDEHVTFLNKLKKIFRYFSKLKVKINISFKKIKNLSKKLKVSANPLGPFAKNRSKKSVL